MKYTTLLFDNDDTLMDFLDAERQGIERTFKENGIPLDENKIAKGYFSNLQYGHKCIDGAYELISNLYKDYDIYVITNGESNTQAKRIKDSGLLPF